MAKLEMISLKRIIQLTALFDESTVEIFRCVHENHIFTITVICIAAESSIAVVGVAISTDNRPDVLFDHQDKVIGKAVTNGIAVDKTTLVLRQFTIVIGVIEDVVIMGNFMFTI